MSKKDKKKTYSLSIFLLKPDINSDIDAIKSKGELSKLSINIGNQNSFLYFKSLEAHSPKWVSLFSGYADGKLNILESSGASAVFFARASGRLFALTFGYGRTLIKQESYISNFGLKVVLNSVDPEKLRGFDAKTLDAVPLNKKSQVGKSSGFSAFGLDVETDILFAATGEPKDKSFGKNIGGKDSLKVTLPIDVGDIVGLLEKLLVQYDSVKYKESFDWIDNMEAIRDKQQISLLNERLIDKIQLNNQAGTWIAVPEVIEWEKIDGFKYQRPKKGELLDDIDWDSYIKFIGDPKQITIDKLKNQVVYGISRESDQAEYEWSIFQCIYCEIDDENKKYVLTNGGWYNIETNFLNRLDQAVNNITVSELKLPDYTEKDEGSYNKKVAESDKAYYALMDRKNINYGGSHSKIEFCDLYTKDKKLIHIKHYGGSSVLSHLFSQGAISARLMVSDSLFVDKVNEKLPESHRISHSNVIKSIDEYEVVYGIATHVHDKHVTLPLFSKINLKNAISLLSAMKIKASILMIPVKK
jgi:uncharacterized protein (TIGR04141 family)